MKIFCVGIGGIGLSAVAQILRAEGHDIVGSDTTSSDITQFLEKSGIPFYPAHSESNLDRSFDQLIYSEAIPEMNPERMKARKLGIMQISFANALGKLCEHKKTIAVTGTHGKTTVTGMLASVLLQADLDPTIVIGSKIPLLNDQNFRIGKSDLFLTEACEYRDNFLHLSPTIMLVNTLEPDHLDYFKTPERYYKSFQNVAEKIPETGMLILFSHDKEKLDVSKVKGKIILLQDDDECFNLQVPGKHNQHNAKASQAVARALSIPDEIILKGLLRYSGAWRRFEYKGEINGAKLYDDYGHHPTEIRATLEAARQCYPDKNLVVIFQPHQYSRTRDFFHEFTKSFDQASEVWITDIYQSRDTDEDVRSVSAEQLTAAITQTPSRYLPLHEIRKKIQNESNSEKVFLVMGAGNIHQIFQQTPL